MMMMDFCSAFSSWTCLASWRATIMLASHGSSFDETDMGVF